MNKVLEKEQKKIINAQEKKIVVYAGPGSGKTYTMIKKIEKDFKHSKNGKGFIANSFTNEASRQLKIKIQDTIDEGIIKKSYIGTTDNFIIGLIMRFAHLLHDEKMEMIVKLDEEFPINLIHHECFSEGIKNDYLNRWLKSFKEEGIIYLSLQTYVHALFLLRKEEVLNYIKDNFEYIYIDEVQDFHYWQFYFFNKLIEECNLKAMYIGDIKQSIYEFRGAKPKMFANLEENGFVTYKINETIRCPEDIIIQSLDYFKGKVNMINESENIANINVQDIILKGDSNMILASTRKSCLLLEEKLKMNNEQVYYIQKPDIDVEYEAFSDKLVAAMQFILYRLSDAPTADLEKEIIEELKKWKNNYNWDLMYKIDNPEVANLYLTHVFQTDIDIYDIITNDMHKYYLDRETKVNRIMTMHQAKGLEADNVYIYQNKNESRSLLFVSFTRAKKKLFLINKIKEEVNKKDL